MDKRNLEECFRLINEEHATIRIRIRGGITWNGKVMEWGEDFVALAPEGTPICFIPFNSIDYFERKP